MSVAYHHRIISIISSSEKQLPGHSRRLEGWGGGGLRVWGLRGWVFRLVLLIVSKFSFIIITMVITTSTKFSTIIIITITITITITTSITITITIHYYYYYY